MCNYSAKLQNIGQIGKLAAFDFLRVISSDMPMRQIVIIYIM